MKYIKYIVPFLFTLYACSENERMEYIDNPAIYISSEDINYSFFYQKSDVVSDDVYVTVHAMGKPSDKDRAFSLRSEERRVGKECRL